MSKYYTKTFREINNILINQIKCTPGEKIERNQDVLKLIILQSEIKKQKHLTFIHENKTICKKTVIISLIKAIII